LSEIPIWTHQREFGLKSVFIPGKPHPLMRGGGAFK
jgi:hypothetical protein